MNKRCFLLFLFFMGRLLGSAQGDWTLKSDKDGIRSYSHKSGGSKINAIRVESEFSTTLSRFVSTIMDVTAYDDWVYASKSTRLVKQVSPTELYYYSEVKFPWPATNRDFVSHITVSQELSSKAVTINATNVTGMVPVKKNIVRIEQSIGKWVVAPRSKGTVFVVYELEADPGGELPVFLINGFSSTGIIATFKNLRARLAKNDPGVNSASFIKE